jgi:hypothetical protein
MFYSMSGELGTYDIVAGNQGDRNDLNLWYNGDDLVCSAPVPFSFVSTSVT